MARTNEALWKRIVASVKAGSKGGRAGQWSARKAQLATQRYKKAGEATVVLRQRHKNLYRSGRKRSGALSQAKIVHKGQRLQAKGTYPRRLVRL